MNDINVPLPRLFDSVTGEATELHPLSLSLSLNITPLSTAVMELPYGENLPGRSYVELFSPMGSAGIFRVRSPSDAYGDDTTTAELEHAIAEVGDFLVKAEIDEMMAGTTAIETIFQHYGGNRWQLGNYSAIGSGQVAVEISYDRVLDCMLAILEQKPECMMSFDFTTSPKWTINIVARDTTVSAEGRLSRNVNSAKITYDDTELCTRAYYETESATDQAGGTYQVFDATVNYSAGEVVRYSGDNKLYTLPYGHTSGTTWAATTKTLISDIPTSTWSYMDADTIGRYGCVERTVSIGMDYTAAEATAAVAEYLRKHKRPRYSVEIYAEELSQVTGEAWDTFTIGKLMRLALADYDEIVEENITGLEWEDVYNKPEDLVVRLAEEEDTVVNFLHDVDTSGSSGGSSSGGGGGGSKKQEQKWKEFYTRIEQTDYYLDLYARHVNELGEILQQAGMYIDSNGVLIYAEDNVRNLGSKLTVQADKIAMVVGTNQDGNYIKVAEIAASINDAGEGIATINANHVNISATNNLHTLAGEIEVDDQGHLTIKSAGGMRVRKTVSGVTSEFGVYDENNLTAGVIVSTINGEASTTIKGDKITIGNGTGIDADYRGKTLDGTLTQITTDFTTVNTLLANKIEASDITATLINTALANATLSGVGTLSVDNSIGCTGPISGTEVWAGGSKLNLIDATLSQDGKTLTITRGSGGAINFTSGGAYNDGWNDCIGAATEVTRYTRSTDNGNGGTNVVHYLRDGNTYTGIGAGWYKTTQANAYTLPSPK